jgi:hypothetical protein
MLQTVTLRSERRHRSARNARGQLTLRPPGATINKDAHLQRMNTLMDLARSARSSDFKGALEEPRA